jgi:CheY-like chemotaxis protein
MDKKHLLVIEDNLSSLELYTEVFEEEGYRVTATSNGLDAILSMEGAEYDLIVTDLKMPEVDGASFALYFGKKYPHVPIVVVSAFTQYRDSIHENAPNVRAFLAKPVDLEILKATVRNLLAEK